MRIAHADVLHVVERLADVVDARPACADALRDEPRTAVQVQLADVSRVRRIGDEGQCADHAPARQPHGDQAWRVNPPEHLALPQVGERAAPDALVDAVGHAPARAAAAQAHN